MSSDRSQSLPIEKLTLPNISKDHIRQKITGIRPMRDGSVCLHTEVKNQKLLVHNYGHGGSGFVLLLGSVNQSIRDFEKTLTKDLSFKKKPICVTKF